MGQRRYVAFISYSHRDKVMATWLHRALETYQLPSKLVGTTTDVGLVPRRLTPIFKDREELCATDSLSAAVDAALSASDTLIVLCSPDAAASSWVNREIERYRQLHPEGRVLAALARGGPKESFPPSLCAGRTSDPIAADLRPEGDGRKLGKLKLIAGLTGVDLDQLIGRDAQRKQRRLALVAAASMVGMLGTSGLAYYAVQQRDEARAQRAEADGLIEYMLTDLRAKLEPVGKLDVLDGVGRKALDYYSRQNLQHLSADELGRRSKALLLVAEVNDLEGHNDEARVGFEQAARSTAELLARDPNSWQRVYDHAQSEFWLAYADNLRKNNRAALTHFIAYRDLAQRLVAIDPKKPESNIERASADVNLGVALVALNRGNEAIASFDRAAATFATIRPRTRDLALNHAQAFAHKASWMFATGDNQQSLALRRRQLQILSSPPLRADDREVQEAKAIVDQQIAEIRLADGDVAGARRDIDAGLHSWETLSAIDPANKFWLSQYLSLRTWDAVVKTGANREAAMAELRASRANMSALVKQSKDRTIAINLLRLMSVQAAKGDGWNDEARSLVNAQWSKRDDMDAENRDDLAAALIADGDDHEAHGDAKQAQARWQQAGSLLGAPNLSSWGQLQRSRVKVRQGQPLSAAERLALRTSYAGLFADDVRR